VAEYGGSVSSVNPNVNLAADAVSDIVDFTGNDEKDIVFAGTSQELKYYHSAQQTVVSTGISIGKDNNVGLGPTKDFNDNGNARTYLIDGSQLPSLVDSSSNKEILPGTQNAAKIPISAQIGQSETAFYYQEGADIFKTNFTGPAERLSFKTSTESGYKYGLLSGKIESIPEPVIQEIRIYDVKGLEDKTTGGSLIDQGLNKTFRIDQTDPKSYRFEFDVLNNGTGAWSLTDKDLITHKGLNQSWNVTNISYSDSSQSYAEGTFNSGNVEWNTSTGGFLNTGDTLEAQYLVNISEASTNEFSQTFQVNLTDDSSDRDKHILKTQIYGNLEASIDRPENNSVVQNNREFRLNGTVSCVEGDCGDIDAEPRRNSSSGRQSFDNQFFEVIDSNSTCSLVEGEECVVEWDINASGDRDTVHELDFEASSQYQEVESSSTEVNQVEIRDILMMDLDWDVVDFGVLDPGEQENPAENNSEGYNLTIEEDSNEVDSLWVKASNLTSELDSSYRIPYYNMSYSEQNQYPGVPFTENYSLVDTGLDPGTVKTFYYWLDVPYGIIRGGYSGSITFKANQSS